MIRGLHHVAVATRDLDRILPFYRDILHWEVVTDWGWSVGTKEADNITGLKDSAARSVMLRLGNAYLELFQYSAPEPGQGDPDRRVCDPGITHLCLDVTDVDAEYARLSADGMVFHSPPQDVAPGVRTVYGRDPDGNVVELQEVAPGQRIEMPWLPDRTTTTPEHLRVAVGSYTFDALAAGPADGEPVLLLHGWPEFADSWTEYLTALAAAGYRAVAFDQRGFSRGARPQKVSAYVYELLVADAVGLADAIGFGRFHLVAHDLGGLVAWSLAAAHPERLRSLTVLATPHPAALTEGYTAGGDQYERLDYVRRFKDTDALVEGALLADNAAGLRAAYGGVVPEPLVRRNVARLSVPGALTATLNWYRATDDRLTVPAGPIDVPTLYVWGSEDKALGREAALRTEHFVTAPYRFEILEEFSHWLPEEAPEEILPMLLEHLSDNSRT